jgi:predicted metal-dependent peptidase
MSSQKSTAHHKIVDAITWFAACRLHSKESMKELAYFAYFLECMDIKEEPDFQTIGVGYKDGRLYMGYNKEFCDNTSPEAMRSFMIHEVSHLNLFHPNRTSYRDHSLSNIAQDMWINTTANETIFRNNPSYFEEIKQPTYFELPDEFAGIATFETIYDWLLDNKMQAQGNGNGPSNGDGEPGLVDHHADMSKMNPEDIEKISVEIDNINKSSKARGVLRGEVAKMIDKFRRHRKRVISAVQEVVGTGIGFDKTYAKRNPRCPQLKGRKKTMREINCILDTSGSMGGEIEKAIGVLCQTWEVNLWQIDTEVRDYKRIRNVRDLEKLKLYGFGGTTLQPAIDNICKSKKRNLSCIVITDGYTDTLNFSQYTGPVAIVSVGVPAPVIKGNKQIKQVSLNDM